MNSTLISQGYDIIAEKYLSHREGLKTNKYVSQLLKLLKKNSTVLDLGCGAGIPVDDMLLKAGHSVIGIDISPNQIKLARKYCPRGQYLVGNVDDLKKGEYQVGAVVSFYTLFHLARNSHLELLKTWASFLPNSGYLLLSMGDRDFEGNHMTLGQKLWSSQFGTEKNKKLIEQAGFKILDSNIDTSGGERHLIILAQKI